MPCLLTGRSGALRAGPQHGSACQGRAQACRPPAAPEVVGHYAYHGLVICPVLTAAAAALAAAAATVAALAAAYAGACAAHADPGHAPEAAPPEAGPAEPVAQFGYHVVAAAGGQQEAQVADQPEAQRRQHRTQRLYRKHLCLGISGARVRGLCG